MTEILKTLLINLWYIALILLIIYIIYSIIQIKINIKKRKKAEEELDKAIEEFSDKMSDWLIKSIEERNKEEKKCNCEKKTKKTK